MLHVDIVRNQNKLELIISIRSYFSTSKCFINISQTLDLRSTSIQILYTVKFISCKCSIFYDYFINVVNVYPSQLSLYQNIGFKM